MTLQELKDEKTKVDLYLKNNLKKNDALKEATKGKYEKLTVNKTEEEMKETKTLVGDYE